jgi:Flp pilus assembly protein TadD
MKTSSLWKLAEYGRVSGSLCFVIVLGGVFSLTGCAGMPAGAAAAAPRSTAVGTRTAAEARVLAEEARGKGDAETALRMYVEVAELDSSDADAFYQIGAIYEGRHDAVRAVRAYTRAVQIDPNHGAALTALGLIYFADHQLADARTLLERAAAAAPGDWRSRNALGLIADVDGRHEAAVEHYAAALAASPGNPTILNNRGYSAYLAGDLAAAEADFKAALVVDEHYQKAWQNLGLVYARRGDYEQALRILQRVVSPYVAANDVGYIAMLSGDYDRAQTLFDDAIRLSPRYYATANENVAELRRRRVAQSQAAVQE